MTNILIKKFCFFCIWTSSALRVSQGWAHISTSYREKALGGSEEWQTAEAGQWLTVGYMYFIHISYMFSLHLYKNTEYSRVFTQMGNSYICFFLAPRLIFCLEPFDSSTAVGMDQITRLDDTRPTPATHTRTVFKVSHVSTHAWRCKACHLGTPTHCGRLQHRQEHGKPHVFYFILFFVISSCCSRFLVHSSDLFQRFISTDYV